jgi:hypothetical protein
MNRRLIVAILVLSGLTLLAQAATAGTSLPLKGSDLGTFGIPGPCGEAGLNVVIEGRGNATHLGRYSYAADECFDPGTGGFAGEPLFTAADGDQLWGHYTGQVAPTADPNVILYTETLSITGGSGRFSGATGELEVDGVANLATGDYSQKLRGWISNLGLVGSS